MKRFGYILLWLLCMRAFLSGSPRPDFLEFQELTVTARGDSLVQLPLNYLIREDFSIRYGGTLVDTASYRLNTLTGQIRFYHPPDSGTVFTVRTRRLPLTLPPVFRHFSRTEAPPAADADSSEGAPVFEPLSDSSGDPGGEPGENLKRSGSIFRGVTVGSNQGMRLQSGLRLQVSGEIAPGVDVTASLTDQNTPIQPEGNTQTLQEIDKVFVNISARSLKATLGDFVFDTGSSGFGSYSRKLQGAMGTAESRTGRVTLIGAASKGQFTTNHFQGQESNQGPYQLTGSRGQREIIVLAGTERVWIDGEVMTRGEDNDYVIEYGSGQLTFTRNRLITSDSRITVDFEYSDLKFQKSIYGAAGEATLWDDRLTLRTTFLHESDDKDNPLDIALTDEYREVLTGAGDSPDSAAASGARYVGTGKGSYVQEVQSGILVYRHVGTDAGDWQVRFSYVGDGRGSYSFQGYGVYRYEGQGRGSYVPSVLLPMARRYQMLNLQSDIRLTGQLHLAGEMGISDQDMNLYSSIDDDDNIGRALEGEFRLDKQPLRFAGRQLGNLNMSFRLRDVGDRFRPAGRQADVEYGRKWGTEEGVFWGENLWEWTGRYNPVQTVEIGGELGDFHRGDFSSQRKVFLLKTTPVKLPRLNYRGEWISSENTGRVHGDWIRHQGEIQQTLGAWTPSVHYQGEHRKDEDPDSVFTGTRFDELGGKIAFQRGILSGFAEETLRDYERYRLGRLEKESQGRIDKIQMALNPGPRFNTSLMFTHRDRDYEDPAAEDQRSDLADLKMNFSPRRRWFDGQFNYQFSSTRVSEMVRDTIQVQSGIGNYRFDENLQELVPDIDGDLLLRMVQTGRFTPVNDLKAGIDLRWDGSRLWQTPAGWHRFPAAVKGRTLFRAERRDSERDFMKVNRASVSPRWGRDSTLVTAMTAFHQDIEITSKRSDFSVRLRYKQNDTENNQLLNENLLRHVNEQAIRVKGNPSTAVGIQIEAVKKHDEKIYATRSFSNRDISVTDWNAEVSYRPRQQLELALKTVLTAAKDRTPDPETRATSVFWVPRVSYAFRGRGNLRAECELGNISSKPSGRSLPYEMFNGDQPGKTVRWNVLMTYRLSGHVMATLNYRARREPWRKSLYQTGQVEVRAFF